MVRIIPICALITSLIGLYFSIRLSLADVYAHQSNLSSLEKSTVLAPGNSPYLIRSAEIAENSGSDATPIRLQAAHANPRDAGNWIRLATHVEIQNRFDEAQKDLARAYAADHQFETRWALANFYYRRADSHQALNWARRSLEFGRGDLNAVFGLCWTASGNAVEILAAIPQNSAMLSKYLRYLDNTGRLEEAASVVQKLLPIAASGDEPAIMEHCNRSLKTGDADSAIAAWNGLVNRHLIDSQVIDPVAGKTMANPGFNHPFLGQGFDWEPRKVDGVTLQRQPHQSALRVDFSGSEPENWILIGAYVAVTPSHVYSLRASYETNGMSGAGVYWFVYDAATNAQLTAAGPSSANAARRTIEAGFEAPPRCRLARIELRYTRAVGTTRPDGSIAFSHLAIEPAK